VNPLNVAIYARVSTEGQRGPDGSRLKGQSVDPQLLELRGYVERQGWAVAGEWTDVMSGTKAARPGLDALLAVARAGGVDAIVVVKLDRLGRSLLNVVRLVEELSGIGVGVICTSQGIDTRASSPCGTMMLQVMAAFAQFERSLIVDRTVAGLVAARARGVKLGRPSPSMVHESERAAVVGAWKAGGRLGGIRGLGRMLGGCSTATAAKLARAG